MEYRILGPLEVFEDGLPLKIFGKPRAVLAMLLLNANQVVSADRLVDALWEQAPPDSAQKALQVYVSRLRKALGSQRIATQGGGYVLRVAQGELDLQRFEELVTKCGAESLREALSLWRGPPLADFAYDRFARTETARLEDLRLAALEERCEADLELGHHAELVGELTALVELHPFRERLRALQMLALYRSGRQAEALDAYQDVRRTLVEELGIEPTPALRELEGAILRQDRALDLAGPADLTPGEPPPAAPRLAPEPLPVGHERKLATVLFA